MSNGRPSSHAIELLENLIPIAHKLHNVGSVDAITDDLDALRPDLTSDAVLQFCNGAIDQVLAPQSPGLAYYVALALIAASRRFLDKHTEAIAAMSAGAALFLNGHSEGSRSYFQFACDVFENEGDNSLHVVALQRLGTSYLFADDPTLGLTALERSLAIARNMGRVDLEAAALNNIGSIHLNTGKTARAHRSYEDALAAARKANDERAERDCLGNLTNVFCQLKRWTEAKAVASQAIEIDQKWKDEVALAKDFVLISRVEKELLEFRQAEDHLGQALELAKDFENHETEQVCYYELMKLYERTDNVQQAIQCGRVAARIAGERGKPDEQRAILAHLAQSYPMS